MKTELTDRFVRNLEPPVTGRIEVSDTKRPGLRLRVSAAGKKVWMFEKRVKGGAKRKHTIGAWPGVSLADARAAALQIEVEASRGIDRIAEEKARRAEEEASKSTRMTVQQVIDLYEELHLSQLRTGRERKRQLEQSLARQLRAHMSDLTQRDLQQAIDEKLMAGRKVFANRIRAALVAFTKWAWARGYIHEDIGQRLTKPTRETARERAPSLKEIRAIYRAAEQLGPLWCPLVRLLLLTGQRRGEIVQLKWAELDLEARRMTKPGTTTKNAKPHITHLSEPALAELNKIKGERSGYVFTTTGTTPVSGLSRMKRRLNVLLGESFEPWRFHDIRTAMATALAEAGVPETIVDRIQNHAASGSAPSAVARVYNQAEQLPERARVLDRWAEMVTGRTHQVVRLQDQ